MKTLKRFLICALAAVMLVLSAGCAELGEFSVNKKIVCEVDGQPVSYDDYKYFFYRHYISFYGDDFSSLTEEKFEKVKAATEDSLCRRAYILSLVDEYDIELSEDDEEKIDEYVQNEIDTQGSEQKYREYLLENRMTGIVYREQLALTFFYDPYLRNLLITGIDNRIKMTDSAIVSDIMGGGFYRYSQIYFEVGAGELDTEAKHKIDTAYAKLAGGLDFAAAANADWAVTPQEKAKYKSEWSADAAKGVYIAKGEKEAVLEETVLALAEGEYSEPVWSGEGWHIFMRLPLDEQYVKDNLYEQVSGEYTLAEQSFARRYLEYINKGAKKIKIEYAKYFDSITFKALVKKETIE